MLTVWQSSKCTSGILWNSHSSRLLKTSCIKIAGCVPSMLLQELTEDILEILQFPSEQLLSKTLDNCFRFNQKLLLWLCFPCSISFKKNVYVTFACFSAYLMKNYCIVLKLQNFDFCIMFSHEINLSKWDNFWKIFLFR